MQGQRQNLILLYFTEPGIISSEEIEVAKLVLPSFFLSSPQPYKVGWADREGLAQGHLLEGVGGMKLGLPVQHSALGAITAGGGREEGRREGSFIC